MVRWYIERYGVASVCDVIKPPSTTPSLPPPLSPLPPPPPDNCRRPTWPPLISA